MAPSGHGQKADSPVCDSLLTMSGDCIVKEHPGGTPGQIIIVNEMLLTVNIFVINGKFTNLALHA